MFHGQRRPVWTEEGHDGFAGRPVGPSLAQVSSQLGKLRLERLGGRQSSPGQPVAKCHVHSPALDTRDPGCITRLRF